MKAIRLGNDIEFVWTVEGLTNVLGTKLVQLFNVNKGIPETMTYEISGDNISGLYKGKDQKEKGSYRLILYVNRGENDMVTLDCVNAFELVGVSNFGIVNGSDESAITIATINLRSTLDAAPVIPSIQAQADWEQSDSTKVDFIKNKPTLFSGDYEDLTNKPTIPDAQIQSDWNQSDSTKFDFIKNKPNVPSSLAELSGDSTHRVVTDSEKETWNNKSDFSGSYNDLTNKPSIPVVPTKVSAFINDVGYVNKLKTINGESLNGEGNIEIEQVQSDWNQSDSSKKDFIKNKPTIPVVPTKVSAFQNDAGYINDVSNKQDKLVSGTNIKTINNQSLLGSGNIDIQGGGGTQVQSDWNETDTDDPAYIKNKPMIPSEVTESTVAGWGFTKNTGTYSKPSTGIPSTDLSSDVQTSLGKADTALQEQVKANWNETNTSSAAYIQNKPSHLVSTDSYDGTGVIVPSDAQRLSSMVGYYECNTSGSTAAKVVDASGYVLSNGGCIRIKMANANTANNVTLNINSTGAKALYYDGAQASTTNTWKAGEVLEVYYDGTQYQCASGGGIFGTSLDGDFEISDESSNVLARFKNGHIETKNFNSAQVENTIAKFSEKSIGIIGDSISTFAGWLPSDITGYDGDTYATYYPHSPLTSVDQTWWYKVAMNLGISPLKISNCSWSGSRVTGDATSTTRAYAGCSDRRISDLTARGFTPDIIICFISCNDWANNVQVGTWEISNTIPTGSTLSTLREAYATMLYKINQVYPLSRLFCCTNLDDVQRDQVSGWPSNNQNGVSTQEWNENIIELAHAFGADVIDVHSCGINFSNIHNYYAVDTGLHPNDAGHTLIANRVISVLKNKY